MYQIATLWVSNIRDLGSDGLIPNQTYSLSISCYIQNTYLLSHVNISDNFLEISVPEQKIFFGETTNGKLKLVYSDQEYGSICRQYVFHWSEC